MQPIYLPFTHISEPIAIAMHDFLGPITLCQSGGLPVSSELSELAEKDLIRIHEPTVAANDDILAALKRDYQAWATLKSDRAGIDSSAFRVASEPIPFFDKNSTAQIRTEINKLRRGESPAPTPERDSLLMARLFLALAQEHDARKVELVKDLKTVAEMEKHLMENLKGDREEELDSLKGRAGVVEDVGNYMTRRRIEAWSTLFLADTTSADIFVTDSMAVVEHLCDTSEDLIEIPDLDRQLEMRAGSDMKYGRFECISMTINELTRNTDSLALVRQWAQKETEASRLQIKPGSFAVYLAPGVSPISFWQRYGNSAQDKNEQAAGAVEILNTLIFHLKP